MFLADCKKKVYGDFELKWRSSSRNACATSSPPIMASWILVWPPPRLLGGLSLESVQQILSSMVTLCSDDLKKLAVFVSTSIRSPPVDSFICEAKLFELHLARMRRLRESATGTLGKFSSWQRCPPLLSTPLSNAGTCNDLAENSF